VHQSQRTCVAMSSFDSEIFSLADETISALTSPKKGLFSQAGIFRKRKGNARKAAYAVYKQMRQATRFVLEDDMTKYVARICTKIDAYELNKMLTQVARLPSELTWLEWDEKIRVKEMNAFLSNISPDDVDVRHIADKVGYLCNSPDINKAIFTGVYRGKETETNTEKAIGSEKINIFPVGFELNFNGPYSDQEEKENIANFLQEKVKIDDVEKLKIARRISSRQFLSRWWTTDKTGSGMLDLIDSIRPVQTNAINWWCDTENVFDQEMLQTAHTRSIAACEGDARFIICLLGVLNFDWFTNEPTRKFQHTRFRYGRAHKGNEYRVITLKLPKKSGLDVNINEKIDGPRTKRLHEVRGHWCIRKASRKRYWRKAHKRGDKSLGTITKDYKLSNDDPSFGFISRPAKASYEEPRSAD
jgi:hypothetical protein